MVKEEVIEIGEIPKENVVAKEVEIPICLELPKEIVKIDLPKHSENKQTQADFK